MDHDDKDYGGGFSGWGFVIFFFLLFMIFTGGGILGGHRTAYAQDLPKCGPTNCEVDRDVIDYGYKGQMVTIAEAQKVIDNQNDIYQKQLTMQLADEKMEKYFLKGELSNIVANAPILEKLNWLENHVCEKPPVYGTPYIAAGYYGNDCKPKKDGYC